MSRMCRSMSLVVIPFPYIEVIRSSTSLSVVSFFFAAAGDGKGCRTKRGFEGLLAVAVPGVAGSSSGSVVLLIADMLCHLRFEHGLQGRRDKFLGERHDVLHGAQVVHTNLDTAGGELGNRVWPLAVSAFFCFHRV